MDINLFTTPHTYLGNIKGKYYISQAIDQLYGERIYSYKQPKQWPVFTYFQSFEINVWLLILFSLVFICLVIKFFDKAFNNFRSNVWQYSTLLLSEPFPRKAYLRSVKLLSHRLVLTVWLLSCTIFLAAFSGVLRGFFIRNVSPDVIDSFEELYHRNKIKVICTDISYFNYYVQNYKLTNSDAREFSGRLVVTKVPNFQIPNHESTKYLINNLKTGKFVYV
jgi:hypothetical protein